jgi:hypothetical protein
MSGKLQHFMKKTIILFAAAVWLSACQGNQQGTGTEADIIATADTAQTAAPAEAAPTAAAELVATPAGMTKLAEASGDLDGDGQAEAVAVFDTGKEEEEYGIGTVRELHIFKQKEGKMELLKSFKGPIMSSESGGVKGDPFDTVMVENGAIVLHHFGGSRSIWKHTHRFRFQDNDWKLIGATYVTGADCEALETFDYNLSTGAINYEKLVENCDEGYDNRKETKTTKKFTNKLKTLPSLEGFRPGTTQVGAVKGTVEPFYY